jgi:hypothetical protein
MSDDKECEAACLAMLRANDAPAMVAFLVKRDGSLDLIHFARGSGSRDSFKVYQQLQMAVRRVAAVVTGSEPEVLQNHQGPGQGSRVQ